MAATPAAASATVAAATAAAVAEETAHMLDAPRLPELTAAEQEAVAQLRLCCKEPITDFLLVRFVLARKGDVQRAKELMENYRTKLMPILDPEALRARHVLRSIQQGALMLPGCSDKQGAPLIVYNANRYLSRGSQDDGLAGLKAVLYLAERAAAQHDALRKGVSILANLTDVSWSKMDHRMHRRVLTVLQDAYPGRICRLYVVNPTLMLSVVLKMAGPFMKRKLQEKVVVLHSFAALQAHVDVDQLPENFGGTYVYDHEAWMAARLAAESVKIPEMTAEDELRELREARAAKMAC